MKRDTSSNRLMPTERQRKISQRVRLQGALRIEELAREFHVSEMTIRRDLHALEQEGSVERTYGGAVVADQAASETGYRLRLLTNRPHKDAIAAHAVGLIRDGDAIAIDASTTCLALARLLAARRVTVITNSLDAAEVLRDGRAQVICVGGRYREAAGSLVGPLALQALSSLRFDHAFFSAKGVSAEEGFVDTDLDEIEVKRAMIRGAAHMTALVDSDKFGVRALGLVAAIDTPHLIVSDERLPTSILRELEGRQVHVQLASREHDA